MYYNNDKTNWKNPFHSFVYIVICLHCIEFTVRLKRAGIQKKYIQYYFEKHMKYYFRLVYFIQNKLWNACKISLAKAKFRIKKKHTVQGQVVKKINEAVEYFGNP